MLFRLYGCMLPLRVQVFGWNVLPLIMLFHVVTHVSWRGESSWLTRVVEDGCVVLSGICRADGGVCVAGILHILREAFR